MTSLKGHLLVASPALIDPNFARTITLIFEHGNQGAAGLIVNRPTMAKVSDISEHLFSEQFDWEKPLRVGGPVMGPLQVVHVAEGLGDQEIMDGLYTTMDASRVKQLILRRSEPSLIVANYAGWGPGQLEAEIKEGGWLLTPATLDRVFHSDDEDDWADAVREIEANGIPKILGIRDLPADPSLN